MRHDIVAEHTHSKIFMTEPPTVHSIMHSDADYQVMINGSIMKSHLHKSCSPILRNQACASQGHKVLPNRKEIKVAGVGNFSEYESGTYIWYGRTSCIVPDMKGKII